MGETFNERIDDLRKRSRILLAQVEENSKKVKGEIKKLFSHNLSLSEYGKHKEDQYLRRSSKYWKLRNDSSGVGGILCPDYYCPSPKYISASMPNIPPLGKRLLTSKKHFEQPCSENIYRKPVKGCYCYPEVKKMQLRSTRTHHKQEYPRNHCKSYSDVRKLDVNENAVREVSTPISCETLRRVQRIDYSPKSQFLRNVQSKVSLLKNSPMSDASEARLGSTCYKKIDGDGMTGIRSVCQSRNRPKESEILRRIEKSASQSRISTTSNSNDEEEHSVQNDVGKTKNEIRQSLTKQSGSRIINKRTLSSKKSAPDLRKSKSNLMISSKSKKSNELISKECPCCSKTKLEIHSKNSDFKDTEKYYVGSEDREHTNHNEVNASEKEYSSDNEVRDLRKFREQNYFDTHGSRHTLLSSQSSGSLEQYLLNDRLFPEPVRRIHKNDLVVTMPPCASVQRKRVHYFPRHIVRQEKNSCNTHYKKRRCRNCPLTGHAVDLGVLKVRPPINSLALKYQKRLP